VSAVLIIAIPVILAAAVVAIVATGRRRSATGSLSHETRARDRSDAPIAGDEAVAEEADEDEGRRRADESRRALGSGSSVPAAQGARVPAERTPVDEEELGLSRRQFFNRGILASLALAAGGFGASLLAFLWPNSSGGFGGKVAAGTPLSDMLAYNTDKKQPFYIPEARAYVVPYPKADLPKAKAVYAPVVYAGMEKGIVALYQKCVHLGCRVPWCDTSQWFECPCHGSKYSRVGEKKGGPAPRGLDRFAVTISGQDVTIDTGLIVLGPPIGTDTTGQGAEGPPCVG
jgi:cytochrome b6-f complex iron-sulfur subunit